MQELIKDLIPKVALENIEDQWWVDTKISEQFLERLFNSYFQRLNLPDLMRKTSYHEVASFVPPEIIPTEVREKLDAIDKIRKAAKPKGLPGAD